MNNRQRMRRVALLCTHFARNMAYYRAGWDGQTLRKSAEFWKTVNGNCVDIAVLEWCKLFADPKDRHCWSKIVTKPKDFERQLLKDIGLSESDFVEYIEKFRVYRDKFVAHLDHDLIAHIPPLDTAWAAVQCYYDHLTRNEAQAGDLAGLPSDLEKYYESCSKEAEAQFGAP